jgi:hypothetical protein
MAIVAQTFTIIRFVTGFQIAVSSTTWRKPEQSKTEIENFRESYIVEISNSDIYFN